MKTLNSNLLTGILAHPGQLSAEKAWVNTQSGKARKSKNDEVINIYELAFRTKFFLESFARKELGYVGVVVDLNKPLEEFFEAAEALWNEFQVTLQEEKISNGN